MEVEREKRDKLAAARKKLNEFKLSRSGATGRSGNPPSVTSSQPADVPLFYQNINSPAPSVNIFNPAAVNNNVTASPSLAPVASPEVVPVAATHPAPVASPEVVPVAATHPAPETRNGSDPVAHQDLNFLPNQQQFPPNSIHQTENVHFNPFSPPTQVPQSLEESSGFSLLGDNPTVNSNQQDITSSVVFQVVNTALDSQERPEQGAVVDERLEAGTTSMQSTPSFSQVEDALISNPSNAEFSPSAPMLDTTSGSENLDEPISTTLTADEPSQNLITENHSNMFPPISHSDGIMHNMSTEPVVDESKNVDVQGTSVPVFASSIFGTTNSELDGIFSFGKNIEAPLITPIANLSPAESSSTTENIPDLNPFRAHTEPVPQETNESFQTQSTTTAPNFDESKIGFNETLEPYVHIAEASEAQLYEHISATLSNHDLASTFPNEQLISSTNQVPESLQYEEATNLQKEATPEDFIDTSHDSMQQMRSVQEALELQIEELRRENTHLLGRQTELTSRIEESERLAHEFKLEKDRVREEATTTSQALRARINSLCEENQRIVKNSTDVGVDLRAKLEEKSKQLEEMQKAVIIVSQSKMEFAGRLDHELECVKELQGLLKERDDEILSLRSENSELKEKLKQDQQKDAVIHQLQDQARHYQVHCETLQRELAAFRNKLRNQQETKLTSPSGAGGDGNHSPDAPTGSEIVNGHPESAGDGQNTIDESGHNHLHSDECNHDHEDPSSHSHINHFNDNQEHSHQHDNHEEMHHHDHSGHHHHDHHGDEHHHHDHGHDDGHHHHHEEGHHHDEGHHHGDDHHHHSHDSNEKVVARRGPSDELTELKKTLHRLEWENSSFRSEIDVLAVDAKQKRSYEDKCSSLEEENNRLRKEVEQLEHVIIQLQGENDTIGDYITLYQTQKMALKECAKEKDAQLELLASEREMLLHRLAELTALVKDLKDSKSEAGSQCADDHMHMLEPATHSPPNNKRQIEGKIRDLLTEISSSSLIENFHPCAVCSGRLMTV